MNASIIIAVYNRREELRECLEALTPAALEAWKAEVLVIDDGSTDGTAEMVARDFPHVRRLKTPGRMGPTGARNLAAAEAKSPLLIFLDSDAVPEAPWLEEMTAKDDGKTVLIGEILDYHSLKLQYGPRRSTFIGKSLPCKPERANVGPSCNLAIPAAAFKELGGFWEEIPFGFEDSFLCINARAQGMAFRYLEKAVVRHKGKKERVGDTIRVTEHNGVYAMLHFYRGSFWKQLFFTIANGAWLFTRCILWTTQGKAADARQLWQGWTSAYKRYYFPASTAEKQELP
ncbi:MAG: glycosyltransferase family 2 protein [Candidatus Hydrogenedentales bacterium]|jgi:GT2 family glycosyltransferase